MQETFSMVTQHGSTLATSLIASSTWSAILEKAPRMGDPRANSARSILPRKLSAVRISALTRRLPLTMLARRLPMRNLMTEKQGGRISQTGVIEVEVVRHYLPWVA